MVHEETWNEGYRAEQIRSIQRRSSGISVRGNTLRSGDTEESFKSTNTFRLTSKKLSESAKDEVITIAIAVVSMATFDSLLIYNEAGARKTMFILLLALCDLLVVLITKYVAARENRNLLKRKRRYLILKWALFVLSLDTKTLAIVTNLNAYCTTNDRNELGKCVLSPVTSKVMTFCYTITFCGLFLQLLSSKCIIYTKTSSSPTRFAVSSLMVLINLCDAIELKSILWRSETRMISFSLVLIHFAFCCCVLMVIPSYFFAVLPKFDRFQPPAGHTLLSVLGSSHDLCFTNLVTMAARCTLLMYDSSLPISMAMLAKNMIMLSVALINLVENRKSERSPSMTVKEHKRLTRAYVRGGSAAAASGSLYSNKAALADEHDNTNGSGILVQCGACSSHYRADHPSKTFQEQKGNSRTMVGRSASLPLQQHISPCSSETSSLSGISSREGEPMEYVNEQL